MDESITSGRAYFAYSARCPPFSHLVTTGGAIGSGPPTALGAAIACPGRRVINLQADGSAMYSLPAFWSMARENADVVVIICSNAAYTILEIELANCRLGSTGRAARSLTSLTKPSIDWVSLGKGAGIAASARASTTEELERLLTAALARRGPSLIEAALVPPAAAAAALAAAPPRGFLTMA